MSETRKKLERIANGESTLRQEFLNHSHDYVLEVVLTELLKSSHLNTRKREPRTFYALVNKYEIHCEPMRLSTVEFGSIAKDQEQIKLIEVIEEKGGEG